MKYILPIAFCILFQILPIEVFGQLYTFKNFNHRNGITTEATLCSKQDKNGYLWIGTDGAGLIRFDGTSFKEVFDKKENLFHVSDIYFDDNNKIYFSTLYEGIYSYQNGKTNFIYKSNGGYDFKHISKVGEYIVTVSDNAVFVISEKGHLINKYRFDINHKTVVSQVLKIPNAVLIFTSEGTIVVTKKGIQSIQNWSKFNLNHSYELGTYKYNELILYSKNLSHKTTVNLNNFGAIISVRSSKSNLNLSEHSNVRKVAENGKTAFFLLDNDHLYKLENNRLQYIIKNTSEPIDAIRGISVDKYGECWINNISGLYKVSIEPFTKISLSPIYNDKGIVVVHKTTDGTIIVGNLSGQTNVGHVYGKFDFTTYNFETEQIIECPLGTILGTEKGIFQLNGQKVVQLPVPGSIGERINFVHFDGENLWFAIRGKNLGRYNPKTKKVTFFKDKIPQFPGFIYNAQNNFNQKSIYFGTNNGVYIFDKTKEEFKLVREFWKFGAFCGSSCKDIYGTNWFTLDKAIVGITKEGNFTYISDPKKLPSTLFYTLSTDKFGNLLVGTNKGINVLKVNRFGNLIHQKNYSFKEGFGGYETNMRACYQNGNYGFVGTIEGLYMINSEALENYPSPSAPELEVHEKDDKQIVFFKNVLGKSNHPEFSYRILGYNNRWSDFSSQNSLTLPELSNGQYVVEVRSTYDRKHFSLISSQVVKINLPIYKTKWFIVVVIIFLGIVNVGLLEWSKSYVRAEFNETRDMAIDIRTIPRLVFYALIINVFVPITVNSVQDEIHIGNLYLIISNSILFLLFIVARFVQSKSTLIDHSLKVIFATYIFFVLSTFYLIFTTNIHPYPLIQLVIVTGIMPFLTSSVRSVLFIVVGQILISSILLIWLDNTIYNEILFILAIVISGALAIMFSYIRLDSLDKLIFVNNLVNRGNALSIAFDESTTIVYASSNISTIFEINNEVLVGKKVDFLNNYVLSQEIREEKIDQIFEDGKIVVVPMRNKLGNLVWIEWTCKQFSENVRVMMGQDITEKLTLSENYRSLVENAQDLIYNTDVNGNFIFANEKCLKTFGYRKEAIIDKSALFLIQAEFRERVLEFYVNQFQHKIQHTYFEFPIRTRDGKSVWIGQNVTMTFEPGSRNRITGFIALGRDITERRMNDLLLEQQNKDITESINAAKRIQFNLLPSKQHLMDTFNEHFLIFKPKEIVSGDFYWVQKLGNRTIVAIADCTGHGVAGAFVTVMGINVLNQLVLDRGISSPATIIEELSKQLNASFGKSNDATIKEELTIAVLIYDHEKAVIASSGVKILHRNSNHFQLIRHTLNETQNNVNEIVIDLKENNYFYLLTDGLSKQIGSIKSKKLGSKRILELLKSIQNDSLALQRKHVENTLRNWSDGHEQTDDITVLAIRCEGSTSSSD